MLSYHCYDYWLVLGDLVQFIPTYHAVFVSITNSISQMSSLLLLLSYSLFINGKQYSIIQAYLFLFSLLYFIQEVVKIVDMIRFSFKLKIYVSICESFVLVRNCGKTGYERQYLSVTGWEHFLYHHINTQLFTFRNLGLISKSIQIEFYLNFVLFQLTHSQQKRTEFQLQ